ncbi:hypothetical protein ABCR94_26935 [Streptomyces sp. 21So2-11]|uniref:hypothetical protein n=1 Tax=Streptomyces sp. 21So2-11 TaxID=3144408 RepID=UPI00321B0B81
MDFDITTEEETLLLRIREHLSAGNMPQEREIAAELGEDASSILRRLESKGWVVLRPTLGSFYVEALTPWAELALSSRRDVGDE